MHKLLKKYLNFNDANWLIGIVLLLSSFAIYLGRYLRWNTWDIIINPFGILVGISDRILNPLAYEQTFTTTAFFFIFISAMYIAFYQLADQPPVKTLAKKRKR